MRCSNRPKVPLSHSPSGSNSDFWGTPKISVLAPRGGGVVLDP